MQLGSISERVEVAANAEMVETKDSSLSEVIDQKRMVDLPLNGRNPTQLILLTGAATARRVEDPTGSKNIKDPMDRVRLRWRGDKRMAMNYLLDGGDNNALSAT